MPGVSIVIPSRGRPAELQRAVACALSQEGVDVEVVVVEQEGCPTPLPPAVDYLWLPEAHVAGARNLGWQRARGDLILFLDDDVEFDSGLALGHWRRFLDDPGRGALAGLMIPRCWNRREEALTFWQRQYPSGDYHWMPTGNLSIPRAVLQELGGFDPLLSHVCEDSELTLRIRLSGYKLELDPDLVVLHHETERGGCGLRSSGDPERSQRILWCRLYAYLKNWDAFAPGRYLAAVKREFQRYLTLVTCWQRPYQVFRFAHVYLAACRAALKVRHSYRPASRLSGPAYWSGPPYGRSGN